MCLFCFVCTLKRKSGHWNNKLYHSEQISGPSRMKLSNIRCVPWDLLRIHLLKLVKTITNKRNMFLKVWVHKGVESAQFIMLVKFLSSAWKIWNLVEALWAVSYKSWLCFVTQDFWVDVFIHWNGGMACS